MYQQQKRYNMAMDRCSDFKLGVGSYNLSGKGLAWLWRPQVAMRSQLPPFLVRLFSLPLHPSQLPLSLLFLLDQHY